MVAAAVDAAQTQSGERRRVAVELLLRWRALTKNQIATFLDQGDSKLDKVIVDKAPIDHLGLERLLTTAAQAGAFELRISALWRLAEYARNAPDQRDRITIFLKKRAALDEIGFVRQAALQILGQIRS